MMSSTILCKNFDENMNRGPETGDQIGNRGSDDNYFISCPIFKDYTPQHRSQCPQPYSVKQFVKP